MAKPHGFSESADPFVQATVGTDGRVLIPAALREAAGIARGDRITMKVEGSKIILSSWQADIRRLQGMFAHLKKPGESVVDGFIAERHAEAAQESDE